ncbi:death-associated inhibitor of apoptosis 1-like [Pseudomyrmex gracilis]|uniref:death-associated inhibitor of apoptosis 1-like n=1 Tax=Pseudomyrmex gracilis TaxID=219809 RepID=UPI000994E122|nr:death-associated inhibitor of apoptosis 1-like [Pseudomyrmex gracilis]
MACIPENCQEEYRFESVRLASFKDWPCSWITPEKLAAAGFYYTGKEDKVKCFECKLEISKWETNDNPLADHQRWSRRCRFVENLSYGNVAISVDSSTIPKNMDKADEKSTCFMSAWPKSSKQTKQDLANTGFYYTGRDNQTLCYYCGGGLRDWNLEDVPWEQHAKWFEYCPFLIVCKGRDYINTVINGTYYTRNNSINSPKEIQEADEKADEDTSILQQNVN